MKAIVKVHSVAKEYICDKIMSKMCINKVNLRYRVVKRVVNKLCLCTSLAAFRYKCILLRVFVEDGLRGPKHVGEKILPNECL